MDRQFEEWVFRCRQCKHYYQTNKDADEIRCRLKTCRFEDSEENTKIRKLQKKSKPYMAGNEESESDI